jgi:hypothetical protein
MNILSYIPDIFLKLAQYTPPNSPIAGNHEQLRKISAIAALNLAMAPLIAYILAKAHKADLESSPDAVSKETCISWALGLAAPLATSLAKAGRFMHQGYTALTTGFQTENTPTMLAGAALLVGGYLSNCDHRIYQWQSKLVRHGMERICESKIPDTRFFSIVEGCGVNALNFALVPIIAFAISKARAADAQSSDGVTPKEALVLCSASTLAPLATAQAQRRQQHSLLTNGALTLASYIFTYKYPVHHQWQSSLVDRLLK